MGFFDRALELLGFGSKPTVSQLVEREIEDLPLYHQIQRIGGQLTPPQVSAIFREADSGYMARLADLANECRQKDGHLQSILGTREMAVPGLDWELVPAGGELATRKDRKRAQWVTDVLRNATGSSSESGLFGFNGLIAHMGSAVYHGRSVNEVIYDKSDGRVYPIAFAHVAPRRTGFTQDAGRIILWDSSTGHTEIDLRKEFVPGKLVIHQPRINGDVQVREGLCRVLIWAALFRSWDLRDWMALGELAWKPWRTGKYAKNADKSDKDTLREVLRGMSSSGVAMVPDTCDLVVEWPKGQKQGSGHSELFAVIGAEMSKAVLGQTLTTEQGSRGSQALGRVHENGLKGIVEFDARGDAETIQRDLVDPLIWMNEGPDAEPPKFRFLTEDAADIQSFSAGIKNLRDGGLRIPALWVRDRIGCPDPEEGDEILGDSSTTNTSTETPSAPFTPTESP